MNVRKLGLTCAVSLAIVACGSASAPDEVKAASGAPFQTTEVAQFASPWAMEFLPDGHMLVTQKEGALILIDPQSGRKQTVSGTPSVKSDDQGALMDVRLAPDYATSKTIYFSFSEAAEGKKSRVALATAKLDPTAAALSDVRVIFRGDDRSEKGGHYSGRIAFSPDKTHLFFTAGDRQLMAPAQEPGTTLGKVLRLSLDGSPAAGNPLAAKGFHPAVWSYGHRNLLGIAFDADGRLWEMEMGPRHGDEINLIKAGLNYGWPNASMGNHYDGKAIPDHEPGDGYEAPKVFWVPAISPGGLDYYNADLFPQWKNSLFITGLSGKSLDRIALDGETATKADHWDMGARIRAVRAGPDGAIWLLEDGENGRLLKLTPAA
ncbi:MULTISPECIES: PQQ-dependent sugar dehydrogenase [unclassified Sphingobium]|uniref:PQQ-dependent sugar dehydrogenase n=1 Tax=unclassified Sphingobium TaxID=2611147 RepID=UPI0022254EB3|nr:MULTISPECIES: PQQ-dependent sugar dehydrogenase [unclassified Sphingobium]MCW2395279.1 glucose/arabinose dehydrogenase [Sphingobium sp. B8D3B]MCW2418793.1 glucose/arabinose dehydrogenase [Sphingobium sp. B8D3C]